MPKLLRLSFLFCFFLFIAGCGSSSDDTSSGAGGSTTEPEATSTDTPETTTQSEEILVLGDSIAAGFNTSTAFPAILQSLTGLNVTNDSQAGRTAEEGAGRISALLDRVNPTYVVVLLGTNNALGKGGGVSGAINSLSSITRAINSAGAVAIIGTLPPIPRSASENSNADAITRGILGIGGARIARIDQVVSSSEVTDGVHPNGSAHQKMARTFASFIN